MSATFAPFPLCPKLLAPRLPITFSWLYLYIYFYAVPSLSSRLLVQILQQNSTDGAPAKTRANSRSLRAKILNIPLSLGMVAVRRHTPSDFHDLLPGVLSTCPIASSPGLCWVTTVPPVQLQNFPQKHNRKNTKGTNIGHV